MKNMKLASTGILLFSLAFKLSAYEGRVTIHVVGEDGLPIDNAKASIQFTVATPGGGLGNGKVLNVEGLTDTNGICVMTGNGDDASVGAAVLKEGYYGSDGYGIEFTGSLLGRWQPWNPTIEVVLQKQGVQVPMYARKTGDLKIPATNQPIGFDLTKGDWVAPYGKGETGDFLFRFDDDLKIKNEQHHFYDATWTISFSNEGDGIQPAISSSHGLRLPRQAPSDGYEPMLVKRIYRLEGRATYSDFREDQNYFFRVRTKKNDKGQIVSALYGKIYGDIRVGQDGYMRFTYYLNPEPNSRNMEFDPRQNLFRNSKPLERVSAP